MIGGSTLTAVPCGSEVAELGEGPRWDAARGELLWVDILGCELHRGEVGPSGVRRIGGHRIDRHLGAVAPAAGGGWVVAAGAGFGLLGEDGGLVELAQPEASAGGSVRMNDGACDPQGRFWAGSMAYDETPGGGNLYRLDGDGSVREMVAGATIANGLGWSPDGRTMYWSDTGPATVDAFAFDGSTGAISDRRTVVRYDPGQGGCDGLTVDDEGALWIAVWGGWRVERRSPAGELLLVVDLPVAQPTSCCFAGPDRDRLVITTARTGLPAAELERQPNAGRLFWCRPGVTGPPAVEFRRS
jgi:sugar lactone lactonase YvrE